jgi:hypothetical protein
LNEAPVSAHNTWRWRGEVEIDPSMGAHVPGVAQSQKPFVFCDQFLRAVASLDATVCMQVCSVAAKEHAQMWFPEPAEVEKFSS